MKTTRAQELVGRVGQRRQVVIPRQIFEALNPRAGDLVAFAQQENGVLIKRKRPADSDADLPPERRRSFGARGTAQSINSYG